MSDWNSKIGATSFRPPSDTSSYFDKVTAATEQRLRNEITQQVRADANNVIHGIVTGKDNEINELRQAIDSLENKIKQKQQEIESLKREKRHFVIPDEIEFSVDKPTSIIDADTGIFTSHILSIIKRGDNGVAFNDKDQEKIRKIIAVWKGFLEEYKWKSNYISVKIKKLLKDTNQILHDDA
jgi:cell division protein FtsB